MVCRFAGESACFVCGHPYQGQQRHLVMDVSTGDFAVYVDSACFERVREIRRSADVSMFEAMLMLSEKLSESLFGSKKSMVGGAW